MDKYAHQIFFNHHRQSPKRLSLSILLLGLMILLMSTVWAQNAESVQAETYVFDYAKVLDPKLIQQYDALLAKIEKEDNIRLEAVILPDLNHNQPEAVVQYFLTQSQKRQPPLEKTGLLLVALQESMATIQLSDNLRSALSSQNLTEVLGKVKVQMQQKDYPGILKQGLGGILYYVKGDAQASAPKTGGQIIKDNLVWLGGGLLLAIVIIMTQRKRHKS